MTVLDVSNYDYETFDVNCLKANGVASILLGCQRLEIAQLMAQKAINNGLPVLGTYAFLYFGISVGPEVTKAVDIARQYNIGRVWLDCESTGANDSASGPGQRQVELRGAIAQVISAGLRCGIYTGSWWWPSYMATDEFSYLPLWHAEYPEDGHQVKAVDYGGWTDVAIHQYTSSLNLCGRNRDANYVFMEEEMEDTVLRAIMIKREWLREWASKADDLEMDKAYQALKVAGLVP